MNPLHAPLRFQTIFKDKIWGGEKIRTVLHKEFAPLPNCGETWEISGVPGNVSQVAGGPLAGRLLTDLIAEFGPRLVGRKVWERFGQEFPLLIKFIDANEDLSIQVHPNDQLARERHNSFGKTEMWYVLQADPGASLISGFKQATDAEGWKIHLQNNTLDQLLNREPVHTGDVFFIPAGRVHTIGKGLMIAEIQQTSDITYRIYDFDRVDAQGNRRELHTELALEAIDFTVHPSYKTDYTPIADQPVPVVESAYFSTTLLELTRPMARQYSDESFTILIAVAGHAELSGEGWKTTIRAGESVLLPAELPSLQISPGPEGCRLLETFVP